MIVAGGLMLLVALIPGYLPAILPGFVCHAWGWVAYYTHVRLRWQMLEHIAILEEFETANKQAGLQPWVQFGLDRQAFDFMADCERITFVGMAGAYGAAGAPAPAMQMQTGFGGMQGCGATGGPYP